MNKNLLKTLGTCVALVVVFGLIMFGINFYTGDLIAANQSGAMTEAGQSVIPDGKFPAESILYDRNNAGESTLKEVSPQVVFILQESTGKGFVFQVETVNQKEKDPVILTYAVSTDGKIMAYKVNQYKESYQVGDDFLNSFIGADNTLTGVELVGGTTVSSSAIKKAVELGFKALIDNNLIKEVEKTPEQLLTDLIPTVHLGMPAGKVEAITNATGNIVSGFKSKFDAGFALIMKNGDNFVLVAVSGYGYAKAFDVEGNDVTSANEALITEAQTYAKANQKSYAEVIKDKFTKMAEGANNFVQVKPNVLNSVVDAYEFDVNGTKYYGFYARTAGFDTMGIYVIVDAQGKIFKVTSVEKFIDESGYATVPDNIGDLDTNFIGKGTVDEIDGVVNISGATMSTNAYKDALKQSLDAFAKLNVGGAK